MKLQLYRIFLIIFLSSTIPNYGSINHLVAQNYFINTNTNDSNNNLDIELKRVKTNIEKEKILSNTFSHIKRLTEKTELTNSDLEILTTVIDYLKYKVSSSTGKSSSFSQKTISVIKILEDLKNGKEIFLSDENTSLLTYVLNEHLQSFRTRNSQDLFKIVKKDPSKLPEVQSIIIDKMIIPYITQNKTFIESSNTYSSKILISEKFLFMKKEDGISFFKNMYELRTKTLKRLVELNVDNLSFYVHEYFSLNISQEDLLDSNTRSLLQNLFIDFYIFPWMDTNQRFPLYKDMKLSKIKLFTQSDLKLGLFDSIQDLQQQIKKRVIDLNLLDRYPFLKKDFSINYKDTENINQQLQEAQITIIDNYILPWIYKNKVFPSHKNYGSNANQIGIPYYKIISNAPENHPCFKDKEEFLFKIKQRIKTLGLENKFSFLDSFFFNNLTTIELQNNNIKLELQKQFILNHLFAFLNKNTSLHDYKFPKITQLLKIDDIKVYPLINKIQPNSETLFDSDTDLKEKAFNIWFSDNYNSIIYPNINPTIFLTSNLLTNQSIRDWAQDYYIKTVIIPFIQTETQLPTSYSLSIFTNHKYKLLIPLDILVNTVSKKDSSSIEKIGIFDSMESMHYKVKDYFINKDILPWVEKNGRFPDIDDFGVNYNQINLDFNIIRTLFKYSYDLEQYIRNHYCHASFMIKDTNR